MITDLRALETFIEVADGLSFADAGRRLGLPASTVTTRVKSLESELGVRLLDRSTRSVAITAEGEIFLLHCQKALHELTLAREAVGAARQTSGQIRVSIPTAFPMDQFAGLVGQFRSTYPDISIRVHVDDRPASFIEDGVDLALRGGAPGGDGLIARHLADTEVIFVGPPGRSGDTDLPVLQPLARRASVRDRLEGLTTRSLQLSLAFVITGQACAYLPRQVCKDNLATGQLEEADGPDGVHDPLPLYLVYHDKNHLPKRIQLFKDFLIEQLSNSASGS